MVRHHPHLPGVAVTPVGRLIVAVTALLSGVGLAIAGVIARDSAATTAGVGMAGPVVGYVLGDRNGEKRLARELVSLEAARSAGTVRIVDPIDVKDL